MKKLCLLPTHLFTMSIMIFALNGCGSDDNDATPATSKVSIRTMGPESPATLFFDEKVTVTYDYEVAEPEGIRIWIIPYTDGKISPKYSYSSSPLFTGKGTKEVSFSITSGDMTVVDQLKISIANADGTVPVSESFEPVDYTFMAPTNLVTITGYNPASPATLTSGDELKLDYNYNLFGVQSIKLDVSLLNEGKVVPASKTISPAFINGDASSQGTGGVTFQVTTDDEDVKIDQIRIFATDTGTNEVFYESILDVDYTYTK